jgi:chromosome segregation ATPase
MDIQEFILPIIITIITYGLANTITGLINKKKVNAEAKETEEKGNKIVADSWQEYAQELEVRFDKTIDRLDKVEDENRKMSAELLTLHAENVTLKDEVNSSLLKCQELKCQLDAERTEREKLQASIIKWKNWAERLVKQLKDNLIVPVSFEEISTLSKLPPK